MDTSTRAISEELRRFLKYYEMTAINSLGGPSNQKMNELSTGSSPASGDRSRRRLADDEVGGLQQPLAHPVPVMTPRDQSCERVDSTMLKGEVISCFLIGGEKRLCFPQMLNTILADFDLQEINKSCSELNIHCSHCSKHQLEILKLTGVLPLSSANCNLITKTDAERLCNFLARQRQQQSQEQSRRSKNNALVIGNSSAAADSSSNDELKKSSASSMLVRHKCFGRCTGRYYPDKFTSLSSKCIQCEHCSELLSPDRFVLHSHRNQETRTCHWGFDSANWRFYVHLPTDIEDVEEYQTILNEMKSRFTDKQQPTNKRPATDHDIFVAEKRPRLEPVKVLSRASPIVPPPQPAMNNATANAVQLLLCDPLLTMAYYHLLVNARLGAAAALPYATTTTAAQPPPFPATTQLPSHLIAARAPIVAQQPQVPLSVEEAAVALLKLSPQSYVADKQPTDTKAAKMKNDLYNNFQHPEPFKKHLLNQFVHEQQQQQQQQSIKNEALVYRSIFENDDAANLELLLAHFVKDPEGLKRIGDKLSDIRRTHDEKIEGLMAQNRILHQEIVYLRNRQNSSTVSSSIVSP